MREPDPPLVRLFSDGIAGSQTVVMGLASGAETTALNTALRTRRGANLLDRRLEGPMGPR